MCSCRLVFREEDNSDFLDNSGEVVLIKLKWAALFSEPPILLLKDFVT